MKGVDYSKQYAKDRDYQNDTLQKSKNAHEKRLADAEARHDHIQTKQRENFVEDKADLEKSYQHNLKTLQDKTRDTLSSTNDKASKNLAKEREEFTKDVQVKRKDFDQRLNDIKSSYQKAFESEKDTHSDLQKTHKERYSRNINDISGKTEKQLAEYQDRLTGAGADLKDQYNRERQQLVRGHEDHMTDLHKSNSEKQAKQKEHLSNDIRKTKEVQEADREHLQKYNDERTGEIERKYAERSDAMTKDYSQRSDNLSTAQQKDNLRTNKEHQEQMQDVSRKFSKELRQMELDKRRTNNGSGEFADVMNRQQGLKEKVIADNKLKNARIQLVDSQRENQERSAKDTEGFKDALYQEKTEAVANRDRKVNELNADKIVTVSKEREKAEKNVAVRELQNRVDREAFEHQLMVEKNSGNERLTKLKENFNTSLKTLEEKHKATYEDISKMANKDKSEFTKAMAEAKSKEGFEVRREFANLMDQTVQNYENRLANYQRENETLKLTMDQKVSNIMDQADKKVESQRVLFESRTEADHKEMQITMDQKESRSKAALNQLNMNFQRKVDKMQIQNEAKLKLLTNDYENKLKELKALSSKEVAQKGTAHLKELDQLKSAYFQEKSLLIQAYEDKIAGMKEHQQEQVNQLQEFKRLS